MRRIFIMMLCAAGLCSHSASAINLSLEECRRMALASDENVKIAENGVSASSLDRAVAKTQYLPDFSGSLNAMYMAPDTKMGDMMSMQIHGAYMAGISLTQPIFAGGKIRAGNRMAAIGEKISQEQLKATKMDVLADAEKSYWTYVAVLEKVKMTRSYLSMMDSIYDMTETSVDVGLSAPQSLLRVQTKRSELLYRLQQAEAGKELCRMALCRVIGVADTVAITPVEAVGSPDVAPAADFDVSSRPETMMLSHNVDIKRQDVKMVRGDFLPTLGLQLGWSAYGNLKMKGWAQDELGNPVPYSSNISSNGFMGVVSLQVPIFHWGEGVKKVHRAKIEVDNALLTLERNRKLMELEAKQAYSNLMTGVSLIRMADTAMEEAEENLRSMNEQFEVGLVTLTDLLDAQTQWQSCYSNVIEARTQYRIYQVEYLRAIGKLEVD